MPASVWVVPSRSNLVNCPAGFAKVITTPGPNCSFPPIRRFGWFAVPFPICTLPTTAKAPPVFARTSVPLSTIVVPVYVFDAVPPSVSWPPPVLLRLKPVPLITPFTASVPALTWTLLFAAIVTEPPHELSPAQLASAPRFPSIPVPEIVRDSLAMFALTPPRLSS